MQPFLLYLGHMKCCQHWMSKVVFISYVRSIISSTWGALHDNLLYSLTQTVLRAKASTPRIRNVALKNFVVAPRWKLRQRHHLPRFLVCWFLSYKRWHTRTRVFLISRKSLPSKFITCFEVFVSSLKLLDFLSCSMKMSYELYTYHE